MTLARSNAGDFVLADSVARAYLRGGQIQISEDDYRLIMSGAPERMIPSQPIPEDEAAECMYSLFGGIASFARMTTTDIF